MTEKPSPLCFDRVRSYAENQSTVHKKFIFSLDGSVGPPAEGPGRRPEQGDMRFCCCGGGSCCCCCCCCGGGCAVDGSGGGGGAGLEGISFAVRRGECVGSGKSSLLQAAPLPSLQPAGFPAFRSSAAAPCELRLGRGPGHAAALPPPSSLPADPEPATAGDPGTDAAGSRARRRRRIPAAGSGGRVRRPGAVGFSGSVRDSALLGRPLGVGRYREALEACAAGPGPAALHDGNATEVGERGGQPLQRPGARRRAAPPPPPSPPTRVALHARRPSAGPGRGAGASSPSARGPEPRHAGRRTRAAAAASRGTRAEGAEAYAAARTCKSPARLRAPSHPRQARARHRAPSKGEGVSDEKPLPSQASPPPALDLPRCGGGAAGAGAGRLLGRGGGPPGRPPRRRRRARRPRPPAHTSTSSPAAGRS